jgi:hypothetical protein
MKNTAQKNQRFMQNLVPLYGNNLHTFVEGITEGKIWRLGRVTYWH